MNSALLGLPSCLLSPAVGGPVTSLELVLALLLSGTMPDDSWFLGSGPVPVSLVLLISLPTLLPRAISPFCSAFVVGTAGRVAESGFADDEQSTTLPETASTKTAVQGFCLTFTPRNSTGV